MSAENSDKNPSEFDVFSLTMILWINKGIYLFFISLSLFVAVYTINGTIPIYTAKAVIEVIDEPEGGVSGLRPSDKDALNRLPIPNFQVASGASSIIPKILGREFLSQIKNKDHLKDTIKSSCQYSSPSILSPSGFLSRVGVYRIDEPSDKQIENNLIECLRKMVSISEYNYGDIKTRAHTISVFHRDPFFASVLANTIVDQFFLGEIQTSRDSFEKTMVYLSESLARAEADLGIASQELDAFLLKNPTYSNVYRTGSAEAAFSIYSEQLADWGILLNQKNKLEKTINKLKHIFTMTDSDEDKLSKLFSLEKSADLRANLSRNFLVKLNELEGSYSGKKLEIKIDDLVSEEIRRLRQAFLSVSNLLELERGKAEKILKLNEKLNSLMFNVTSKEIYLDGLKNTVQEKQLTFGQLMLKENKLYSKATPPIEPSHPDVKGTILVCMVLGIFFATVFILLRQLFTKRVYTEIQLGHLVSLQNKMVTLNQKDLKLKKLISGNIKKSSISKVSIISGAIEKGKRCCFIELSSEGKQKSLCDRVSLFFANMFSEPETSVICLNSDIQLIKYFDRNNQRILTHSELTKDISLEGKIILSDKRTKILDKETSTLLKNETNNYDTILLSVNKSTEHLEELISINGCDFFVLIGRVGKFTIDNVMRYVSNVKIDRDKFAGLILVR